MKTQDKIRDRVQVGLRISEPDYVLGIVYLLNCLFSDYFSFVELENRLRGVMVKYQKSINKSFLKIFEGNITEEKLEICGKVVFLYKTLIFSEYKKLTKSRLSKADRILVIIKRILDFLDENDFILENENLFSINEIVVKLFDNIKWKQKENRLMSLMRRLNEYFDAGFIGKKVDWKFSIKNEEEKYSSKAEETTSEILFDSSCETLNSTEIELT